jgi:exopolysaccharide biosynthesis polyprenyl glycosylphosphotransferase
VSATPQTSASASSAAASLAAVEPAVALPTPFVLRPRVESEAGSAVPPRRPSLRAERLRRRLMAGDFVAVSIAATLQAWGNGFADQLALLAIAIPLWIVVAGMRDLYRTTAWRWDHAGLEEFASIVAITAQWGLSALVLGWATGMLAEVKIGPLAIGSVVTVGTVFAVRALVRWRARRCSWYWENAIVLGPAEQSERVVRRILRQRKLGINVMACVEPAVTSPARATAEAAAGGLRHIGPVPVVPDAPELLELMGELDLDRVIIAGPLHSERQRELIAHLADHDVHIDLVPDWGELVNARLEVRQLAGVPLLSVPSATVDPASLHVKRAFDAAVSLTALVLLSPVLLACAIAIKLDTPGPVFFRQRRVGKDDRRFEVLKFRSMHIDAERRKAEVAALNFHGGGNDFGMFKIRQDPRITRVGGFLRRTSLDELPQLVNVLRGEMSLVGPRPLIESEHAQISGRFRRRSAITPGLTGLWQVNGRSEVPFDEMISLDLLYAATWSLRRDLKLLARTVSAVLRGDGAY